jgi:hypothetical protein
VTAEDFKTKKAGAEKKTTEPMKASAVSSISFSFPIGQYNSYVSYLAGGDIERFFLFAQPKMKMPVLTKPAEFKFATDSRVKVRPTANIFIKFFFGPKKFKILGLLHYLIGGESAKILKIGVAISKG